MAPRKLRPGLRLDELVRVDDPDDPDAPETYWGRSWMHVTKHDPDEPYLIANELICSRLAAALGLPVLPGEVARDQDGTTYWAIPGVRSDGGISVPPSTAEDIAVAQPQIVAGMIVFDAWVNNTHRFADSVLSTNDSASGSSTTGIHSLSRAGTRSPRSPTMRRSSHCRGMNSPTRPSTRSCCGSGSNACRRSRHT